MHLEIDQERCCAAGQCVLVADDLFDQRDEDGVVVLLDANPEGDAAARAAEAAALCPAAAITVVGS
ncbi:ferredoxin [Streptomyces sulfonofaciens]|uniref:Ferredoxin n=1 Tax=Streptomyces sulfonofaciens TaxID=68272 RepID=A0A919GMH2_9ACTN|nr:ferredoxin [Streptomyces sulfonofaciens]GHH86909.1 ferredoxin [Streptomyces sulfonofaciens]